MSEKPSYPPIRRFVTGHDADNVAKVIMQGSATNAKHPNAGTVSTLIWSTDRTPADVAIGEDVEDLGARIIGTAPPANGTRFAVIDFPPGNEPRMHRTETIDYVIVLEGEIEMDMDQSTVKLKAGDVMVQRGTNHVWAQSWQDACPRGLRVDRCGAAWDRSPRHRRGQRTLNGIADLRSVERLKANRRATAALGDKRKPPA